MPAANDGWLMQSSTKYQAIGYSVKKVLTISKGSKASCLRSLMDFIKNFSCCL